MFTHDSLELASTAMEGRGLARRRASIAVAAVDAAVLSGLPVGPLAARIASALEGCRGRGCEARALGAAAAYYAARWAGLSVAASQVYRRLGVPKQSFHNALARLLEGLGHSPAFRRVLRGELGARVCRVGVRAAWEHYGAPPPPRCPGALEEWPGGRPPAERVIWRMGALKISIRTTWDGGRVVDLLREAFGDELFTAAEAAKLLLIDPRSAATLLDALAEMGLLERSSVMGRRLYRVKEEAQG